MNDKLTFPGGEPDITIDNLLRKSIADRAALFGLLLGLSGSTDAVISGAAVTIDPLVDAQVTSGYVWLNGEILQVDAATVAETEGTDLWEFQKQVTYDSLGDKTFNDGTPRQTYQKNRAILVNVATVTGMNAVNPLTVKGEANDGVRTATIQIGPWDMDTDIGASVLLPGGITPEKIIGIKAVIYNDTYESSGVGGRLDMLNTTEAGAPNGDIQYFRSSNQILLSRETGGYFDGVLHSNGVINRGYVTVEYLE